MKTKKALSQGGPELLRRKSYKIERREKDEALRSSGERLQYAVADVSNKLSMWAIMKQRGDMKKILIAIMCLIGLSCTCSYAGNMENGVAANGLLAITSFSSIAATFTP